MASTFHGLELGKRGLYAQQSALSTTGHNIANANTTGYTRQRAEMQATKAISYPGMHSDTSPSQIGTGVEVNKLVRLREEYLDVQIRGENKNLGYWEAKSDTLSKIEEVLNEPSETGLAATMDQFWKGWQELAKNPDSAAARGVVKQRAIAVAETFNYLSGSLNQMKDDLKTVINTKETEVNSLAEQIGSLNDQIARMLQNNYQPNDLLDQRDVLVDQLSKLVNVKTMPTQPVNGMVDVFIGSEPLVSGRNAGKLEIGYDSTGQFVDPSKTTITLNGVTKQAPIDSGELYGRMESFGILGDDKTSTIPGMKDQIDALAKKFIDSVNDVHKIGIGLDGSTGLAFFTGTTAADIAVNKDMTSLDKIAAGAPETGGGSSTGNGKNAQLIGNLQSSTGIDDSYRNIIGQLGIDSQESQRMRDNSEVIVNQIENRRQSVSGVSLDEEMANMIKFQQAYNASARMVSVMDECLDKIINGMGRVGM
jgi:flagellar hook-associated protein 1